MLQRGKYDYTTRFVVVLYLEDEKGCQSSCELTMSSLVELLSTF